VRKAAKLAVVEKPLKLDLGCGKTPRAGFTGVDCRYFGQDITADLRQKWPWKDGTVEEAHCSHFVEHLKAEERIHFVNELYRVLKVGAKCQIIVPHWASCRAYGDLTHQWPPVSEFWFYYLDKNWREQNAPHNDGYKCDFLATWGYSLHPAIQPRNTEYQQHAMQFFKEAAQDIIATLTKR
jgi:hypothetical protein